MRYLALCCDYDGTLATDGRILPETLRALERLIASGRRLVLVTGRELDDLQTVCPYLDLFEYVVAENGALLYQPSTRSETPLAAKPPDSFVAALRRRGVERVSVGRVIVATWEPHETQVLQTIRDLGLELQVIFNKGAVMVLPAGVTKASGLKHALKKMAISAHNAVGIGDAENDHALLAACECSAAVSNALPTLKEAADIVTRADHGAGVAELIEEMLRDDLASREPLLSRHHIVIGRERNGREVRIPPYGERILVLDGASAASRELTELQTRVARERPSSAADAFAATAGGSGDVVATAAGTPAAVVTGFLSQLSRRGYTFCVIDPTGRFALLEGAVQLGSAERTPSVDEIVKLLRSPDDSGVIHLSGLTADDRPAFFATLAARLVDLRAARGLPHWVVMDQAHEMAPAEHRSGQLAFPGELHSRVQITASPKLVAAQELRAATLAIATGGAAREKIDELCHAIGVETPSLESSRLEPGEVLAWRPGTARAFALQLQTAEAS